MGEPLPPQDDLQNPLPRYGSELRVQCRSAIIELTNHNCEPTGSGGTDRQCLGGADGFLGRCE
jgi:hypothetical protein